MFWKVRPSWEYYITCKDMWGSVPEEVREWLSNGNEKKELSGSTSVVVAHWFLNQECVPTREELSSIAEEGRLDILKMLKERDVEFDVFLCASAASNGHVDVLEWLYKSKEECSWEVSAVAASLNGSLEVLKWLKAKELKFDRHHCKMQAACGGQLGVLRWLKGENEEDDEDEFDLSMWGSGVFAMAVKYGHLNVIDWVVSIGFDIRAEGIHMIRHIAASAASGGQIDVLKELKWDGWRYDGDLALEVMNACVKGGNNLETLKFLVDEENFSADCVRFDALQHAIGEGHIEMVKFVYSHSCRYHRNSLCEEAARAGQLEVLELVKWSDWSSSGDRFVFQMVNSCLDCVQFEVLKYLVEEKFDLKCVVWSCFESVIRAGHIEMLKFLSENGVNNEVRRGCVVASGAGQLEVLKWFGFEKLRSDVGFVAEMVDACVKGVHFELLKFLFSNGFNVRCVRGGSIDKVILKGNLEMLKFLYSSVIEFENPPKRCAVAAFSGKLHVLKWLLSDVLGIVGNPCTKMGFLSSSCFCQRLTMSAAHGGSVKVLKFLDARGFLSKHAYDACHLAAKRGHLNVIKFLHSKGCEYDIRICAASCGQKKVEKWCLSQMEEEE